MKMGEKLTFVNFMEKITDGWVKIIFRQDVMRGVGLVKCMGVLVKCMGVLVKEARDCRFND